MTKPIRFVGLDVHAATIAVAVADRDGEVRSLGTIPNEPAALRRCLKKLGPLEQLRVCYEAGPTGYVLYWQLTKLGVRCEVVAPTLIPVKPGDRVKFFVHPDGSVVLLPKLPASALRGMIKSRRRRPATIAEMTDAAAEGAAGVRSRAAGR